MSSPSQNLLTAMTAEQDSEFLQWTKSEDVWYEDGNIILTAGGVGYRVFRGILAHQSPIFADMLGIPQPVSAPTYDGCVVVSMPESASEMLYFLQALHDTVRFLRKYCSPRAQDSSTIYAIILVLQLSAKYEVSHLEAVLYTALQDVFPTQADKFHETLALREKLTAGDFFFLANTLCPSGLAFHDAEDLLVPIFLLCAHQDLAQIISSTVSITTLHHRASSSSTSRTS
ncbi:hypothetical protein EIP91_000380 [Steccherinum ochraceum]|uniref:BTB domain-containing protein n=1 Tax=Steccherinum ochraceum TaxID=92696 RepID=A0A4R0RWG0_9APHY|nr:hypothetical protein EIP91_000380 [Steccherinum ochraceum]